MSKVPWGIEEYPVNIKVSTIGGTEYKFPVSDFDYVRVTDLVKIGNVVDDDCDVAKFILNKSADDISRTNSDNSPFDDLVGCYFINKIDVEYNTGSIESVNVNPYNKFWEWAEELPYGSDKAYSQRSRYIKDGHKMVIEIDEGDDYDEC